MNFARSEELQQRLLKVIPGGSHTYAKGADQFPESVPGVIARGSGCHVWDVDGNEFIEYGMGLRAVTLGHAYPAVINAVANALSFGTNFTRPALLELECAERFLSIIKSADMVKFTKDGSTANTAALRLARAYTGRQLFAVCTDHPFFSYDDWFMCSTTMDGGIPAEARSQMLGFSYNDLEGVRSLFAQYPGQIAAVFLEAARTADPKPGFLAGLRDLCDRNGAVLVFDEIMTGFRWHLGGAQALFDVVPDLSCFGKALGNGFAISALCGKRELMRLGSRERPQDNVFLLSTTHGAEATALSAALASMNVYQTEPVIETLMKQGDRLRRGVEQAARLRGVQKHFEITGRSCSLLYATRGLDGAPSQQFRTVFLQEAMRRGVLMPSLVVSYSHTDADIDRTVDVIDQALVVYARALSDGVERHLVGRPSRVVYDHR